MADLLQSEEVKTARQILVDLGIVGGSGGLGIFGFLRWKRKRPIRDVGDPDQQGVVVVQTGDGSAAHVHKGALLLTENPRIRKAVEGRWLLLEKKASNPSLSRTMEGQPRSLMKLTQGILWRRSLLPKFL